MKLSRLPLTLMLLAAVSLIISSFYLSKREKIFRHVSDRSSLLSIAGDLQKELLSLEALYDGHLFNIANKVADARSRVQIICSEIKGVSACTFLPFKQDARELHIRIGSDQKQKFAQPTFIMSANPRFDIILLNSQSILDSGLKNGWIKEPGYPMMYWWLQADKQVIVLTLDLAEIQTAMQGAVDEFLQARGGLIQDARLIPPGGMESDHPNDELPHWTQPLPTRYGIWQIADWDEIQTVTTYHTPTLTGGVGLSVLLALIGVVVHIQQRRSYRLASQRVSFVNRVSHELRTPLTNMILNLDLVEESLPEQSASVSRLALVREEVRRLGRLVENVLTFSRQDQKTASVYIRSCDPVDVVDEVVNQFRAGFTRRNIQIERVIEGNKSSFATDSDALAQITANLLSNVEKYAPDSKVIITTWQDENGFTLKVADEGPGIARSDLNKIFEPFVRLDDSVKAGITGTGLGLSIARELAKTLNGSLSPVVDEQSGETGACFILQLPNAESYHENTHSR